MSHYSEKMSLMRDPRDQYPRPPFEKQPQDAPGLDRKMKPEPDHGEKSYVGSGRLEGRRALITGGDSGIGRAVAIAYAREGAEVTINYLPQEQPDVDELAALFDKEGLVLHQMPGDLTDEDFTRALPGKAKEKMGGLDVLVNNAGKQVFQEDVGKITTQQFDRTMRTNIYATFWLCQEALEIMPPGASIINVTSIQGYDPSETLLDYATSKFAIRGFTLGLAKTAIEEKGIRVNGIAPGPFWTVLQPSGGQSQEKVTKFGEKSPMGRPGQPAEIAAAFVYLASHESSYTVGTILSVTGGEPTA
ncbi:MAG: SDR family oxidoreductase [Paracoccus sp. (in: a-proteobacteria)]|nr:SDR family oxidoreductase [Paracoccus sp. (in: a-proteobacteria)]